jgi:hypothetical protein
MRTRQIPTETWTLGLPAFRKRQVDPTHWAYYCIYDYGPDVHGEGQPVVLAVMPDRVMISNQPLADMILRGEQGTGSTWAEFEEQFSNHPQIKAAIGIDGLWERIVQEDEV